MVIPGMVLPMGKPVCSLTTTHRRFHDFSQRDVYLPRSYTELLFWMLTIFPLFCGIPSNWRSFVFSIVFLLYHNENRLKSRGCCPLQIKLHGCSIKYNHQPEYEQMKLKSCKINIHEHGIKEIISFSIDHFQCLQGWERLRDSGRECKI